MAEVTGTIAAVVQLTQTVLKTYKTIKHAPIEIQRIEKEVQAFEDLCKRLQCLSDVDLTMETYLTPGLDRAQSGLQRALHFLKKISKQPELLNRARWTYKRDEARGLLEALDAARASLSFVLQLAVLNEVRIVKDFQAALEPRLTEVSVSGDLILGHSEQQTRQIAEHEINKPDTRAREEGISLIDATSANDTVSTIKDSKISYNSSAESRTYSPFCNTTLRARKGCRLGCQCACHRTLNVSWAVAGLLGRVQMTLRGVPFLAPRCNDRSCLGTTKDFSFKGSWFLPQWLAWRNVDINILSNLWSQPCAYVTLRNVLPLSNEWWVAIKQGKLYEVQRLIAKAPWLCQCTDERGLDALTLAYCATEDDQDAMVNFLLRCQCDPYAETNIGSFYGHVIMEVSLEPRRQKSWMNQFLVWENFPEIHQITIKGRASELRSYVLRYPGSVHYRDEFDRTALIWAVCLGHVKKFEVLLEYGSDINVWDTTGLDIGNGACLYTEGPSQDAILERALDQGFDLRRSIEPDTEADIRHDPQAISGGEDDPNQDASGPDLSEQDDGDDSGSDEEFEDAPEQV